MNLVLISSIVMGMSVTLASDSFRYNGDAECTIPFLSATVESVSCVATTQWNQQQSHGKVCYFDDMMMVGGAFELNQKVNRYFSATFKFCYHGSNNKFYQPTRCKTIHKNIDMWEYAVAEQEYEEEDEEEVKEGYNYQYYQSEESQQWAEAKAEYEKEQADALQTYLYPGVYSWNLELQIPSKSAYFGNGSELQVTVTLTPKSAFYIPYYREVPNYKGPIADSKYKTQCYLTFDAISVYGYRSSYHYFSAAGLGFLLLGAATYVTSKRRVFSCTSGSVDEVDDCYYIEDAGKEQHQETGESGSL